MFGREKITKSCVVALFCAAALLFAAGCENYNSYKAADELFESGQYEEAAGAFDALGDYKDASERADAARGKIYEAAELLFGQNEYEKAIEKFLKLGNYRDAPARIETIKKQIAYEAAVALMEQGEYGEAAKRFAELGDYKDASELADDSQYKFAEALFGQGKYEEAIENFTKLGGYKDAPKRIETIKKQIAYEAALALAKQGKHEEAANKFAELGDYKDALELANDSRYKFAESLFGQGKYEQAIVNFTKLGSYKDAPSRIKEVQNEVAYKDAESLFKQKKYGQAIESFAKLGNYKDAAERVAEVQDEIVKEALAAFKKGDFEASKNLFKMLPDKFECKNMCIDAVSAVTDYKARSWVKASQMFYSLGQRHGKLGNKDAKKLMDDMFALAKTNIGINSAYNFDGLYVECLYNYYDDEAKLGKYILKSSGYPAAVDLNTWRNRRIDSFRDSMEARGLADYYDKTDRSVVPAKVSGRGIYINNKNSPRNDSWYDRVKGRINPFSLADSAESALYVLNFTESYSYYGRYDIGASAYELTLYVTLKNVATGEIVFQKTYSATPAWTITRYSNNIYDEYAKYYFYDDEIKADILPALSRAGIIVYYE